MDTFKKQLLLLYKDKYLFSICCVLPIFFACLMHAVFHIQIPRNLPIGIVDEDNTTFSREIRFDLQAAPSLHIEHFYTTPKEAKQDLSDGEIYGLVIIPKGIQRNVKLGIKTILPFYYNAQFVLIGKAISSAFLLTISNVNAKASFAKAL